MFLDAMDFKNNLEGICVGDPLILGYQSQVFLYNPNIRWWRNMERSSLYQLPPAEAGEAIFSASGTNISFFNHPDFEYGFVTGGLVSNLFMMGRQGKRNKSVQIPILQGKESTGTFSMATDKMKNIYCIGGDYKLPKDYFNNFYYSTDAGAKWGTPSVGPPYGYRSCIQIVEGKTLVACGPTGVDYAPNGQKEWKKASLEGFNVCMVSKTKEVFFAGENGKIGKMVF